MTSLVLLVALCFAQDPAGTRFVETPDGGYTIYDSATGNILGVVKKGSDGNFTVMDTNGRAVGTITPNAFTPAPAPSPQTPAIPLNRDNSYQPPTRYSTPGPTAKVPRSYGRTPTYTPPVNRHSQYYDGVAKSSSRDGRTTYSNSQGQRLGYSSGDKRGNTTYYDTNGGKLGTSKTFGSNTYYYDRNGRPLGK
jgi:hypothetical protein